MKFLKLKLENFKPYYGGPDTYQDIRLFDKERKGKNITIIVGQTGYGKTSICEAIMWCLYGEGYKENWEEFVNTLSISVARQTNETEVGMSVHLYLEIDGDNYVVIRHGSYDLSKRQKTGQANLSVLCKGEPLPNPRDFVIQHFVRIDLMNYFVFDADDILTKFQDNRETTIKEHINKLAGVQTLDQMVEAVKRVRELYDDQIGEVESRIQGNASTKISEIRHDLLAKDQAIQKLENDMSALKQEQKDLFGGSPSGQVKWFSDLVDRKERLENTIAGLNTGFKESGIADDIDLLLFEPILDEMLRKMNQRPTTKDEFDDATEVVRSSLHSDYQGIVFDERDNTHLVGKETPLPAGTLRTVDELRLDSGTGKKSATMKILRKYKKQINERRPIFDRIRTDFKDNMDKYIEVVSQIAQIGETSYRRETRDKYKKWVRLESQIGENRRWIRDIEGKIIMKKEEIEGLKTRLTLDEEQRREVMRAESRKQIAEALFEISIDTRRQYLSDLLSFVNKSASEFLRNTVKESKRFHSIEVNSDYQFVVKQENGESLEESQINRGNLQISMMAFFFGLSKFLDRKIPYVIDNPLLRLDPGHDKRLIEQLSKSNDQFVFHLIPGKEYTSDSFDWLSPHVNIQNWLVRREHSGSQLTSWVDEKNPEVKVEFDINNF